MDHSAEQYLPVAQILELISEQTAISVKRANLSARVLSGPNGRESMLERLRRLGLARTVQRGSREDWEVSTAAVSLIAERATGTPGPPSGAQISLAADQVVTFARYVATAGAADSETILDALYMATGLAPDKLAKVQRIVIPRRPRYSS